MRLEQGRFALDTSVEMGEPGVFTTEIHPDWCIGSAPNGGYLLATVLRALRQSLPYEDPITVSSHFYAVPEVGEADIEVDVIRVGRTLARGEARLLQGGVEQMRVLAAFGTIGPADSPPVVGYGRPPTMPPPDECASIGATTPDGRPSPVRQHLEIRYHPDSVGWASGAPSGKAQVKAWMRLADGSPPNNLLIPFLLDVLPASVYDVGVVGWVPTIELTVHQRARPKAGWLLCSITCRFAAAGVMEENGEVWDDDGRLIATCRQIALLPKESMGSNTGN